MLRWQGADARSGAFGRRCWGRPVPWRALMRRVRAHGAAGRCPNAGAALSPQKPRLEVAELPRTGGWEAFIVSHALIQLAHYNVKLNDIITKLC